MTDQNTDPRIASWLRQEAPPAAAPALTRAIVDATRGTRQRGSRSGWLRGPLLLGGAAAALLIAVIAAAWWQSPSPVGPDPTPVPSSSAAPTVSSSPSASGDAVASPTFDSPILRLADIPNMDGASGFGGARPHDIVVGGPGLVAVGAMTPCCADASYDDTWAAAIWTSPDGRRWELLADLDTFGKAGLRAVAVNDDGLMVAAGYEVLPPTEIPSESAPVTVARLWRSTNGVDWFSAPEPEGDVHDIAAWRDGWVTVGNRDDEAIVATSIDGETWTTHVMGPGTAEYVTVDAAGAIAVAGCMLASEAVDGGCEPGLATSTDGDTWTQERIDGTVRGIAASPQGGFVAVGGTDGGSTAWASVDGSVWESAVYQNSPADGFTAIAVDHNGLIAAEAPLAPGSSGRIWHSFDGLFWTLIAELEPNVGEEITATALAFRDAQYVVLGTDFTDAPVPVAWHGP